VSVNGTNYPSGSRLADQRIVYDQQSQRWVATTLDGNGSQDVILAVSNTDSPTNLSTGWSRYVLRVQRDNLASDFPTLGIDGNGLYVTVLHFGYDTNLPAYTNAGHTVVAVKKPDIYQGTLAATRFEISVADGVPVRTIQPAIDFDDVQTNGYAWFVAKGPPDIGANYQAGAICYRRLKWVGTNALLDTNWSFVAAASPTSYRDCYDLDGPDIFQIEGGNDASGVDAPDGPAHSIPLRGVGSRLSMVTI